MCQVQQKDISSLTTSIFCTRQQTLIRRQHENYLHEIFGVAQLSKGALSAFFSAISSSVALQSHSKGLSPDATQQKTPPIISQTKCKSQGTHQFFISMINKGWLSRRIHRLHVNKRAKPG